MGKRRKNPDEEDNGFAQWGGYMEAKRTKLMEQFSEQTLKQVEKVSEIFKGVAILVNGYTKPNTEELKILMAQHGGMFHMYQIPSTTHIIASNLPNVKINKLGNVPIVKPGWVEDSITLGRLLDYSKYLLYTNQSKTQPRLNFTVVLGNNIAFTHNNSDNYNENISTLKKSPSDSNFLSDCTENVPPKISSNTSNNNAKLLLTSCDSKITKTASDPKFLSEFYNNSRLHLISTLGAEFKQLVNDMREKKDWKFPGLEKILRCSNSSSARPTIMHIDMDCFFVSVGLRTRPDLRGKPVAVTHSKGGPSRGNVDRQAEISMYMERLPDGADCRLQDIDNTCSLSEIASCSYEARRCGIKNGMFMGAALKLCPDLKAIPYDFQGYREVSNTLYRTLAEYTLDIEAVSCDEMYVDVTKILQKCSLSVMEWAAHIRAVITDRTGCPCSTGFGGNRLQARLATRKAKPNGAFYLKEEDVESYLMNTPLADLPGVGRATLVKLKTLDLETCGDVQMASLTLLKKELGVKAGETIADQARGIDKKPLKYEHERKSVSAEVNYGIRFKSEVEAITFFESLSNEVKNRLQDVNMKARCVTLKVMVRAQDAPMETAKYLGHGVCDSISRSSTLNAATDDSQIIFKEVKVLYEKLALPFEDLRGVGIQLSRLEKEAVRNNLLKNFLNKDKNSTNQLQTTKNYEEILPTTTLKPEINLSLEVYSKANKVINTDDMSKNPQNGTKPAGRGRPKGSKNSKQPIKSRGADLSNYFKCTQRDRPTPKSQTLINQPVSIDMAVLEQLPLDIREEIIKEYKLSDLSKSQSTSGGKKESNTRNNNLKSESGNNGAKTSLEGFKKNDATSKLEQKRTTFETLSSDNFKGMLKNWLKSGPKPHDIDVSMLGDYFKSLATNRKIEDLHILIKFLHRTIEENGDCIWHDVYFRVIQLVQEGMIMRYGGNLLVPKTFNCSKHL